MRQSKYIDQLLATIACSVMATAVLAQEYPNKPVRIVVPFSAGGLTDVLARGLGEELGRKWKQPVLVDNRPGANTIIGARLVADAAPTAIPSLWQTTPLCQQTSTYIQSYLTIR